MKRVIIANRIVSAPSLYAGDTVIDPDDDETKTVKSVERTRGGVKICFTNGECGTHEVSDKFEVID